jgi:hypothetical protein
LVCVIGLLTCEGVGPAGELEPPGSPATGTVYAGLFGDDRDAVAAALDGLVPQVRPPRPDEDDEDGEAGVLARR